MTATFVLMSTLRHLQPVTFSHWVPMKQHFWCSRPIRRFFVANASTFRKSGLGRPNIAIAGSTGAVGVELLACLSKRKFPFNSIKLLASARSAGSIQEFMGQKLLVEELNEDSFHDVDIALFSAGGTQSKRYAPAAVKAGCIVIDNSSAFRMDPTVPLVVPEVNPEAVHSHKGIIANPNCSTIIMNVAVWPLYQLSRISRIVVSTYQAASGAGAAAMRELEMQAHDWVQGRPLSTDIFSRQYLWNLFSHDSSVDAASGYNEEELKMMQETRKIFADEHIQVTATCIRVPVLRAHCESINLSFTAPVQEEEVREALRNAPGLRIVDDRHNNQFPEPVIASGVDDTLVGRIRPDLSQFEGKGFEIFVAGDQLLKGAALNAVQIAELLLEK